MRCGSLHLWLPYILPVLKKKEKGYIYLPLMPVLEGPKSPLVTCGLHSVPLLVTDKLNAKHVIYAINQGIARLLGHWSVLPSLDLIAFVLTASKSGILVDLQEVEHLLHFLLLMLLLCWMTLLLCFCFKAEVRSSFITTTVLDQSPRSHHKGATSRVRTGDQLYSALCQCHYQFGQGILSL